MTSTASPNALQILPVSVAGGWLALEASAVQEVIGRVPVTRIPSVVAGLIGVLAWRGRAVAILDLAQIVGQPSSTGVRTVMATNGTDTVALCVDAVREVAVAETVRPIHVARLPYASQEAMLDGIAMPLFDLGQWLEALQGPAR